MRCLALNNHRMVCKSHRARSVVILREKCRDLRLAAPGGWLVGPPLRIFFLFILIIFSAVFNLRGPTVVAHVICGTYRHGPTAVGPAAVAHGG
jgi:hypothetical protein